MSSGSLNNADSPFLIKYIEEISGSTITSFEWVVMKIWPLLFFDNRRAKFRALSGSNPCSISSTSIMPPSPINPFCIAIDRRRFEPLPCKRYGISSLWSVILLSVYAFSLNSSMVLRSLIVKPICFAESLTLEVISSNSLKVFASFMAS